MDDLFGRGWIRQRWIGTPETEMTGVFQQLLVCSLVVMLATGEGM